MEGLRYDWRRNITYVLTKWKGRANESLKERFWGDFVVLFFLIGTYKGQADYQESEYAPGMFQCTQWIYMGWN